MSKKKKSFLIIVILLVVGLGAAYVLGAFDKVKEPDEPPEPTYGMLSGVEVDEDVAKRPILGVMIENHPDARPQTGLDSASIVFETVAEGGITRYLALYQEDMPNEFGPIRSVRAYYVNWAMGFDASIAHVGGSADALELLESRKAKTLSQFTYPDAYRRINNREAPHNMYATSEALRDLQKELNHKTSTFATIPRSNDAPTQTPTAPIIQIQYSYNDYAVEFRYDAPTNSYVRYLTGKPDIDAGTQKPITVKNLVVLKFPTSTPNALGSGEALLFKDGTVQTIKWQQPSYDARIKLTDTQGTEVPLNRGDTWFAGLTTNGSVKN